MRRHAEQCTYRHNARTTDASHKDRVGCFQRGFAVWFGQIRQVNFGRFGFARCSVFDADKAWAKPILAGKIFVAGGLVNLTFTPQWRFQWLQRNTVGLHAAIAAAFADLWIDVDPLVDIRELAPLAAAAFFGGTCLHIDQRRQPLGLRQPFLHRLQIGALAHHHPFGELRQVQILFFVVNHFDCRHAHGLKLVCDAIGGQSALVTLPAGHGHGIVEQDFIGHRGIRGQCGTNGLHTGMVIGAIAQILEHMPAMGKF